MTSWVLSIGKDYPQHWGYAKRDRIWDFRTRRRIHPGDMVYFWIAQQGLAGRGLVSSEVRDSPTAGLPWDDAATTTYAGRIDFAWLEDYTGVPLSWGEIKSRTGIPGAPQWAPRSSDSEVEARLRDLFARHDLPESTEQALATLADPSPDDVTSDRREIVLAQIRLRQGQPAFRNDLLQAYNRRCAVTGTSSEAVLEAAHILPYRGVHTNIVANGLLLRSDIHTLFDRLLLTVTPSGKDELITRVAPELEESIYAELNGLQLASVPTNPSYLPSPSYLRQHAEQCTWLH